MHVDFEHYFLSYFWKISRSVFNMASTDFEQTTGTYLAWLAGIGVKINPKIAVADFRKEGRGRGIGKSSIPYTRVT